MSLIKRLEFDDIGFNTYGTQQFATVVFDRQEDSEKVGITVIKNGEIYQFLGTNTYNPSTRRISSCVYCYKETNEYDVFKICTIQHKGETMLEIHSVDKEEMDYFRL